MRPSGSERSACLGVGHGLGGQGRARARKTRENRMPSTVTACVSSITKNSKTRTNTELLGKQDPRIGREESLRREHEPGLGGAGNGKGRAPGGEGEGVGRI